MTQHYSKAVFANFFFMDSTLCFSRYVLRSRSSLGSPITLDNYHPVTPTIKTSCYVETTLHASSYVCHKIDGKGSTTFWRALPSCIHLAFAAPRSTSEAKYRREHCACRVGNVLVEKDLFNYFLILSSSAKRSIRIHRHSAQKGSVICQMFIYEIL